MALASLDALTSFGLSSSGRMTVGRLRRAAGWHDHESGAPCVVGLEKQTDDLLNFMRGVAQGQENNSVLIVGDSGTGKETLVQRALARLAVEQAEKLLSGPATSSASGSSTALVHAAKGAASRASLDSTLAEFDVVFLSGDHLKDDCDAVRSISAQLSLDVGQAAMARALGTGVGAGVEKARESGEGAAGARDGPVEMGSGAAPLLTPPRSGAEVAVQGKARDAPTQEIHKTSATAQGKGAAAGGASVRAPLRARAGGGAEATPSAGAKEVPAQATPQKTADAPQAPPAPAPKPSLLELHRQAQLARLQVQAECGLLPSQQPKSGRGRPPTLKSSSPSGTGAGTGAGVVAGKKRPREASPTSSTGAGMHADDDASHGSSSDEEEDADGVGMGAGAGAGQSGSAFASTSLQDLWLKLRASKMSTSSGAAGKSAEKEAAKEQKRLTKVIKAAARVNPGIVQSLRSLHGTGPEADLAVYKRLLDMDKRMPAGYTLLGNAATKVGPALGSSRRSSNASSVLSDVDLDDGEGEGGAGGTAGTKRTGTGLPGSSTYGGRSVMSGPGPTGELSALELKRAQAAVALVVKARRGIGGGALASSIISSGNGPIVISCSATTGGPVGGVGAGVVPLGTGSTRGLLSSPIAQGLNLSLTLRDLPKPHSPQVVQAIINLENALDQAQRLGCSGHGGSVGRRLQAACVQGALLYKRASSARASNSTADSRGLAVFRGSQNEQYVKDGYDTIGVYGIDPTSLLAGSGADGSGSSAPGGAGTGAGSGSAVDAKMGITDSLVPKMVPKRRAAGAAAAVLSSSLAGKKAQSSSSGRGAGYRAGGEGTEASGKADKDGSGGPSTTYTAGNYEVHLDFVLQALQSGGARPVFIIIRGFEAFARKTRQTLLYSLLDLTQSPKVRLAIIGLTSNVDTVDMLEKRLKSRFSSRLILTRPPTQPTHILQVAATAWAESLAQCGLDGGQVCALMGSEAWRYAVEDLFSHAGLQAVLEAALSQGQRYAWYAQWLVHALPAAGTYQPWKAAGKPNLCALPSLYRLCHPQVLSSFCCDLIPVLDSVQRMSLATLASQAEDEIGLLERGIEPRRDAFSVGNNDNAVVRLAKAGFAPSALRSVPGPVLESFKQVTSAELLMLCAAIAVHRRDKDSDGTSVLALAYAVGSNGRGGKTGGSGKQGGGTKLNFARVYTELQAQSKALALGGTGAGAGQLAHGTATVTGTVLAAASAAPSAGSGPSAGGAAGPGPGPGPLALSEVTALDAWEGLLQKDLLRFLYPSVVALTASSATAASAGTDPSNNSSSGSGGGAAKQSGKAVDAYPALSQSTYAAAPGLDSIGPVLSRAASTELLSRHEGLRWAAVALACDPAHVTLILETAAASVAAEPLLPLTAYEWCLPVLQTAAGKVLTSQFQAPRLSAGPASSSSMVAAAPPEFSHLLPSRADSLAWASHLCPAAVTVGERIGKWMITAASGQV